MSIAPRFRIGLVTVMCATALYAATAETAVPNFASAAPVSATIYIANYGGTTVTSYQASASGNASPSAAISSSASGTLSHPADVAFDSAGDLWVASEGNSTVLEYASSALQSACSHAKSHYLCYGR